MSDGNLLDARHPIKGLETGDSIAWTIVTGEVVANDYGFAKTVRQTMFQAKGVSDVLVLAIPQARRAAVYDALALATKT